MKRLLSILLAIVMVFSMLPVMAFATGNPTIYFETDFQDGMQAGDSFTVTVSISGIGEIGIGTLTLSLDWNPDVLQFDGFARKTTGAKKLITEVLTSGNVVAVDAVDENGLGIPGKVVAADLDGYWDEGALFTANFTIKAGGDLGLGLKSGDGDVFQIKNLNSEDVQTVIDTSAVEGKKAAGAGAGPKYEDEWPFSVITANNGGSVIDVKQMNDLEFDAFGYGDIVSAPYYHVTVSKGVTEIYVKFKQSADTFVDQYFAYEMGQAKGGNFACVTPDKEDAEAPAGGMAELKFTQTEDGFALITIPASFAATGMSGDDVKWRSALKNDEAAYYAAGPQNKSYATVALFSFEYGEAAGGEEEPSHTHSYTEELAVPEAKVADATCQKGATYRMSCADETCGVIAPDEEQYYFYSGETVPHNYVNHVCSYEDCTDPNEPKYDIIAAEGITVTSDAAGENAITNAYAGDTVYLYAAPQEGKTAVFTVGENVIPGTSFIMPAEEVSVSVSYKDITYYNITVDSNVVGGTIKAYADDGHTEEITGAYEGQTVYLEPVPNAGYRHTGVIWYKTGDAPQTEAGNGAFIMPGAAVTVSTVFTANNYSITVEQEGEGTVNVAESAKCGNPVTLDIVPADGYLLTNVTATYGEENTPFDISSEFTMPAGNVTINVTFLKQNNIDPEKVEIKHPSIEVIQDAEGKEKLVMTISVGVAETLNSILEGMFEDEEVTQSIVWKSSDDTIATVDAVTGKITAIKNGVANIYAEVVDNIFNLTGETDPLVNIELTVTEVKAGYNVTLDQADTSVKKGQIVEIPVKVGYKEEDGKTPPTAYNAYELVFDYDAASLELTNTGNTTENEQISVVNDAGAGTVTIRRYGNAKDVGTEAIKLTFTAKEMGSGYVKLVSSKVSESKEALQHDAAKAEIVDAVTQITVDGYTVTLPDEFTGNKVADPTQDYTFYIPTSNWDYTFEVKVNGDEYKSFTGEGTKEKPFTIAKADLTGNIEIKITEYIGKRYDVSITEDADMVPADGFYVGEDKAQYMTDYKAVLTPAENYDYRVVIKIGDAELVAGESYLVENNVYTIKGQFITDDITITVTKTEKTAVHTITFAGNGAEDVVGITENITVANGQNYTFALTETAGYAYSVTVTPEGAFTDYSKAATPNADGSSFNHTVTAVTGNLTISIVKSDLTVEVENYLDLMNNATMFLIKAQQTLAEDQVLKYGGNMMFLEKAAEEGGKDTWRFLVIVTAEETQQSGEQGEGADTAAATLSAEDAKAMITAHTLQTGEEVLEFQRSYDVNEAGAVDINDAQLVYDMYKKLYNSFDSAATVSKFLRADVNGDGKIDTQDAQAIVAEIVNN